MTDHTQTRREYRLEHNQPRFIYVDQRGERLEDEGGGAEGAATALREAEHKAETALTSPRRQPARQATLVGQIHTPATDGESPGASFGAPTSWDEPQPTESDELENVALDDALPEPPAAFRKIRDAITKMFGSIGEVGPAPQFLDAKEVQATVEQEGQGEWWDESATEVRHEVSTAPDDHDPVEVEPEPEALTPAEARAKQKAQAAEAASAAKAEKERARADKIRAKREAAGEAKRIALAAKEQKALDAQRKREADAEMKVEQDEVKTRARRERHANASFARKQKRREAVRLNGGKEGFWQGTSKPKPMEIANAIRSLAIILETTPAEIDAVKMLAEEYNGTRIGDAYDRIYDRLVKDNLTLVEAFAPESIFPQVVHNMLKVGAMTAKTGPALRTAVGLMDTGNNSKRTMLNAIREPLILAVLSMAVLFITAWTVVPIFMELYEKMNMEVGAITTVVVIFADISIWVIGILGVAAVVATVWWFAFGRSSIRTRIAIDRWLLHAPLIGRGQQSGQAYRMFNILSSYLTVGATERESLLNTAGAMENRAIKRHLRSVANGLTRGEKTFAQFLDDDMFPRMARGLMGAGQRSGQALQVVKHLRDTYEEESKIEVAQSVEKVSNLVSGISSMLFTITGTLVSIPPLEIFGSTLGFSG